MPRSTTPAEGRQKRNDDRVKRMIRVALDREIDSLVFQLQRYSRAATNIDETTLDGEIKHLRMMILACRNLQTRFTPNKKHHVPQEERGNDAEDS